MVPLIRMVVRACFKLMSLYVIIIQLGDFGLVAFRAIAVGEIDIPVVLKIGLNTHPGIGIIADLLAHRTDRDNALEFGDLTDVLHYQQRK